MKKIVYIFSFLILLGFGFSCEDKPDVYEFPKDEYMYEIPDVPVTEDYVIGVSYDTKYRDTASNVWWDATNKQHQLYTGTPVLGEYDVKKDDGVLLQHLKWGKEAGINFFVLSWGGHGYNDTILANWENYYRQDPAYPKVVLRFDPGYRFKSGKDTLQNMPVLMDSLRFEFDSIYTHVMSHDFGYKKNGTPVMVLCNFTNSSQLPRVREFTAFLKNTANNNLWIMADLGGGWTSPERWGYHKKNGYADGPSDGYVRPDSIAAFDAFYITDISHNNYDRFYSQYSYLDYNYKYWQTRMLPLGKEYIPTVMPGYDDRVAAPGSDKYLIPRWNSAPYVISSSLPDGTQYNFSSFTENPYKKWANVAKRNVGPSRMIMIFNWNDFGNGRNLEPVTEFGTDYLKYTKEFFKKQ
jgi:hypothetical protein